MVMGRSVDLDAARPRPEEVLLMYSILYIIGAIVVIIVVLRLLGLY
jgi:hypothetical protein